MKVSIFTFSKEYNYGANLQCYALSKILKGLGHDVDIIDAQLSRIPTSIISRIISIPNRISFWLFQKSFFRFTRHYSDYKELCDNPPLRDAYIVGSDQVWNPEITKRFHPEAYFFSFVPKGKLKIAYAASFGMEKWHPTAWDDKIKSLIKEFHAVGVREYGGRKICKETFDIDASVVLDPTLLLTSYDEICGKYKPEKQTKNLIYFKFVKSNKSEDVCKIIARNHQLTPIYLGHKKFVKGFRYTPFVSVKKWLNSIRYADFVIADSFHCLSFCLIFRKQFISLPSAEGRSGRMQNLLSSLGISERFCATLDELNARGEYLYNKKIDYKVIDEKLESLRNSSLMFLKKKLS